MSGRTKTVLYRIVQTVLWIAALACAVWMYFRSALQGEISVSELLLAVCFSLSLVFLPINALVHESGHLFAGLCAGMGCEALSVSFFTVSFADKKVYFHRSFNAAGETRLYPKSAGRLRGRTVFSALGGAMFNIIYSCVLFICYVAFPFRPALLFFAMFAPLSMAEGISALLPAELSAGKTDGKFVLDLIRRAPSAEVALRVMEIQARLIESSFREIERNAFFDFPTVREDDPSFLSMLHLRWRYLLSVDDTDGAIAQLKRLESLADELSQEDFNAMSCEFVYAYAFLLNDAESAEKYVGYAEKCKNRSARLRAKAALAPMEKRGSLVEAAEQSIRREKFYGIAQSEREMLSALENGYRPAQEENENVLP